MKRIIPAFALLSALAPAVARADGGPGDAGKLILAGTVGEVVIVFGFGVKDLADSDHSTSYGVLEAAVNVPVAAAWGYGWYSQRNDVDGCSTRCKRGLFALTAVHTALAVHGVYAAIRAPPEAPANTTGVHTLVVPVLGEDTLGAGVVGRF